MVEIGKLNKRITLQKLCETEDESGNAKVEWVDFKAIWATVKPFKSSEYNFMGKLKPEVTHRIYVRYRNDITPEMRIKYHGRIFEISGHPLDIDEAHKLLEIQAQEVFEGEQYSV